MERGKGVRTLSGILLMLVVGAVFGAAQSGGYSSTLQNQVTTNNCSAGEPVALSGTINYQLAVGIDPDSGANTFTISVSNNLSGVGQTTGGSYAASDSSNYILSSTQSSTEATVELKTDLTSQGSAPSMTLDQTLHIVVDTTGNVSAQVTGNATQCGN